MKTTPIDKIFPISCIEDDIIVNGAGDLTFGFAIKLPEIFTVTHSGQEQLHNNFIGAMRNLPVGSVVHSYNEYYTDEWKSEFSGNENYIQEKTLVFFDGRPVIRHRSFLFFTLPTRKDRYTFSGAGDYVFKKPFRELDTYRTKIFSLRENMKNALSSIEGIEITPLTNERLLEITAGYFNQDYGRSVKDLNSISPYSFTGDNMKVGDRHVSIINMVNEGPHAPIFKKHNASNIEAVSDTDTEIHFNSHLGLVYPLSLGLPFEHILSVWFEIMDTDTVNNGLREKARSLNLLTAFKHQPSIHKKNQIAQYLNNISEYGMQPAKFGISCIINEADPVRLSTKKDFARKAFYNMNGTSTWTENHKTLALFMKSAPGCVRGNERSIFTYTEAALAYFPKETHYAGDAKGNAYVDRFGNPVMLDLKYHPLIRHKRNFVVFGPTGQGKSVWINDYTTQSLRQGNSVLIIDVGGSYKRNCALNGGYYFDAKDKSKLSFNLFLCAQDADGNYIYRDTADKQAEDDKINYIYTIVRNIYKRGDKTTPVEKAVLKKLIIEFYEYINRNKIFPLFDEFYKFIDIYAGMPDASGHKNYIDFEALKLVLGQYTRIMNGQYRDLFNNTENINLKDERFIVFDIEALGKDQDLKEIILTIIIELATEKIEKNSSVINELIIDEAIDSLTGEMGDFIGGAYRRIRKKDGVVGIATQGISYLKNIDPLVKDSIISNTGIKVLLSHKGNTADYPLLKEFLTITDYGISLLDSVIKRDDLGYREFFIQLDTLPKVYRLQLSPENRLVYSTTKSETREMDEIATGIKSDDAVIAEMMARQNHPRYVGTHSGKNEV